MTLLEELQQAKEQSLDRETTVTLAHLGLTRIRDKALLLAAEGQTEGKFRVVCDETAPQYIERSRAVAIVLRDLLEAEGIKPTFVESGQWVTFSWEVPS